MLPRIFIILFALALLPQLSYAQQWLVDSNWLVDKLNSKDIAIVDMSDSIQYSRFHIPGARHLPYNAITHATRQGVSLSVGSKQIMQILGQLGITADMHIVIYDDTGGLNASRLFWELERIGHQKLSLLDGGLVKWILEGKKVVASHARYPKDRYKATGMPAYNNLAGLEEVSNSIQKKTVLLDVRSKEEYTGHPRQKRSGHIPAASWWHWEDNVSFENNFQFKPNEQLMQRAKSLGLNDKKQPIIIYCRSGHRAAHSYFTLRKLGYQNVRLYDGSMAEYSQSRGQKLKLGENP